MGQSRALALFPFVVLSCAHNVSQDKATTADGRIKGAKPLSLDNGEAKDSGIVTYPGGDRVDWKVIELPDKKRGTLDVTLTWTTPRPGLKLAFDVFDGWNNPVGASAKGKGKGHTRTASIEHAKGKYFIRVYAVGRGDAGKYKLGIEFKESVIAGPIDWLNIPIDGPPKLAELPGIVIPCDEFQPDLNNPECKKKCWQGAPANWPGCTGTCTANPPDPNLPVCAASMPCPKPKADRRVKACRKIDFPKCADPRNPDPDNPNCDGIEPDPVFARITKKEIRGNEVVITIGAGAKSGIGKDWTAYVLQGTTDKVLAGGKITITDVSDGITIGHVGLTPQQVDDNKRIRFTAPKRTP